MDGMPVPGTALPEIGDEIAGKYRIEGVLGQGGMGAVFSAQNLLQVTTPLSRLRGQIHHLEAAGSEPARPVWVTYHPAYLLRSPQEKARAWEDLKAVRGLLERPSA